MIQKVLIVDNDRQFLSDFGKLLRSFDFEVWTAGNHEELDDVLLMLTPDLLIFDIILGSESGPDIYDRVMRVENMPKIPVVFVSDLVDPRSESPMVRGRQVAMYAKPLQIKKLVMDIRAAFSDSSVAA